MLYNTTFCFMLINLLISNSALALTPVFINEIHYDNIGDDISEAIEIFGPAGTNLADWSIVRYNGADQNIYTTPSAEPASSDTLSGTIPDLDNGYGVVVINYKSNGLQNGTSDGIVLVDNNNVVIQFLSYESSFTAIDGVANNEMSSDIGVTENANTPVGYSLQLTGTGTNYEDFTWNTATANTFGSLNTGQALPSISGDILINEIVTDPQQDWSTHNFTGKIGTGNVTNGVDEWLELYIATSGSNLTNWIIELNDGSDVTGDLTNNKDGAFQVSTYIALNDGGFTNTAEGDYLILGNVKGDGQMSNNITIILKDPLGTVIDQIQINGNATGIEDEAVARIPNATDTNDFKKMKATIGNVNGCGSNVTKIHTIQGNGITSPEIGNTHTIEGVVVGDFQADEQLQGFFIQEENSDIDSNLLTFEGIFIYNPNGIDVSVGDVVLVTGEVDEYFDLTELKNISNVTICSSNIAVIPVIINLPLTDNSILESYEGMLVNLPQILTVTDNYSLGHYGQFTLSNGRLFSPTNVVEPGFAANELQIQNDLNRIIIDDGSMNVNPELIIYPSPQLSANNTLRSGSTVANITGILTYSFNEYRIHSTSIPIFTANPRLTIPVSVGGTLKVASFNVLNYFNGDRGFPTTRGADTASEFTRQRNKIISAIVAMDADIIGLMEMENNGYGINSAIQDLINGLNTAAPTDTTYAFITPDFELGSDAIKVALIYRVETVTPVDIATTTTDFPFNYRRPPLAQTFKENASAGQITVVVNHFKAKSSCPSYGNLNEAQNDGQGCWNAERTEAANTLTNWLAIEFSTNDNILIIGDLNAYAKEDPITTIKAAGYTDLVEKFNGINAYSYIFNGQAGYLDHALASANLTSKITGVTEWHINADEPKIIDYNEESKSIGQLTDLYNADPYRASDHDPLIIGLDFSDENIYAPVVNDVTDNDVKIIRPSSGGSTSLPSTMTVIIKFSGLGFGTVTSSPNGINCHTEDTECKTKFDTTSRVTLTTTVDSGSEFDYWIGEDCDTEIFMISNHTCTAYFKLTPRILTVSYSKNGKITSSPAGIDCGNISQKCSYKFENGKTIKLTAKPNSGYIIESWSENCANDRIKLLENSTCSVSFTVKPIVVISDKSHVIKPIIPQILEPTENINHAGIVGEVQVDLSSSDDTEITKIIVPIQTIDNTINTNLGLGTSVLSIIDDDLPKPVINFPNLTIQEPYVQRNNICSSGNVIDTVCNFGGNDVTDIIIGKKGNLSHLIIKSNIDNQGRISNAEITIYNQVSGGILSGYIVNNGILDNFEFVGASITGLNKNGEIIGRLSGKIFSNSKVNGSFENILLAPNTHIIGGILEKQIIGDKEQPATLKKLLIKSDSIISNVILAENVTWEEGVTFGENVTFSIHRDYMQSHNIAQLPALGNSIIMQGQTTSISFAKFTGGTSENGDNFKRKIIIKRNSQVIIQSNILVDVRHIDELADILVVAVHEDSFYMLSHKGEAVSWNGNISNLIAFQTIVNLAPVQQLNIWNSLLDLAGNVKIYVGYRLADGKIVYSPKNFIEIDFIE
ncbi:MAG: ExeM/NucH family extracellular endonuclease [Candidatus Marithrix sp.]